MKISACWIVKNEAENIERSMKSVAEAVDEMIVVDTGSDDDTAALARAAGAMVHDFEWINDFSAAKNFAIAKASGEIMIFPDADEWFEPALSKADRDEIIEIFSNERIDVINCRLQSVDNSGSVKSSVIITRIFHTRNKMHYENRIHEKLVRPDGVKMFGYTSDKWLIKHSGYTEDKTGEKLVRNLEFLEALKAEGAELSTLDKFYLMRENFYSHRGEEAYIYFDELLHSKRKIAEFTAENDIGPLYFYIALDLSNSLRLKVSRNELYSNVVEYMHKLLPDYPGTAIIGLYYMLLFARNESNFLVALEEYDKAKDRGVEVLADDYYRPALQEIYKAAATAALRRGNKEAAMEYAIKSITCYADKSKEDYIKIFIKATKGAGESEIILLLSRLLSLRGGGVSETFLESLMYERLKNVYMYFFKKQYEAGTATKARFLYLKILSGNPKEAAETALMNSEDISGEVLSELIFCAVICAGDYDFFLNNKEHLGRYTEVARAYFENSALENPDSASILVYITEYRNIVFAAGKEAGDRFLSVFERHPSFRLLIKGEYYLEGALYDEFLAEEGDAAVRTLNASAQLIFVKCFIGARQYEPAFDILNQMVEENRVDYEILNNLFVIAENTTGGMKERAKNLYDEYSLIIEEMTDLRDMVNTGVVFDELTKKEKRALASLTPQSFKQEMFKTRAVTSERLLDVYKAVAKVYMEKGQYGMAERYLRKLLVSGYKAPEVYANLAEAYGKLGNAALAEDLAKKV